jgi:hypothetical protein
MPDTPRPGTFKEVVAAEDPAERARIEKSEHFDDVTVGNPFHRRVSVLEDRDGTGSGASSISTRMAAATSQCSPARARDYFHALKFGRLRTGRD